MVGERSDKVSLWFRQRRSKQIVIGFMCLKVSSDKSCLKVVSTEQRNTTFNRIVSIVSERLDKPDAVACINPKIFSFSPKDVNTRPGTKVSSPRMV